jgi:tetratricopeptide (TPR) repeat protein
MQIHGDRKSLIWSGMRKSFVLEVLTAEIEFYGAAHSAFSGSPLRGGTGIGKTVFSAGGYLHDPCCASAVSEGTYGRQSVILPEHKISSHIRRAQALGDNSAYVRNVLSFDTKTFAGTVVSSIPLTVGYTYHGKHDAEAVFGEGEAAFGRSDWAAAAKLYAQAAALDPGWYDPALYAGDSFFRVKDGTDASIWFAKAIAIDPDRETAYRYWGDALFQAGDAAGAREKFVEAVVAEPYGKPPITELGQWAQRTGQQLVKPAEFTTPDGALRIDPELGASNQDGRSSWIIYEQFRVAHGARTLNQLIVPGGSDANAVVTPSGYSHTIAEEQALRMTNVS